MSTHNDTESKDSVENEQNLFWNSSIDELSKTADYLKDKYDLDVTEFTDSEYLSNMEFAEMDEATLLDGLDDEEFEAFDFEEEDN